MVKIILWGLAPLETEEEKKENLIQEVKSSLKPKFHQIKSFFSVGIKELKKELRKAPKAQK